MPTTRDSARGTDSTRPPRAAELFGWTEDDYLRRTEGSALRRLGYWRWLRNLAIALGNSPRSRLAIEALRARLDFGHGIVREHVQWALERQLREGADEPR